METTRSINPMHLMRCYLIFDGIMSGHRKYVRDESDTYSPVMAEMRDAGVTDAKRIDAILGCQRYLILNCPREIADRRFFHYLDRVLICDLIQFKYPDWYGLQGPKMGVAWFAALADTELPQSDVNIEALHEQITNLADEILEFGREEDINLAIQSIAGFLKTLPDWFPPGDTETPKPRILH